MTWDIVAGIIALAAFIITVVKTIIPLTNAVTKLTENIISISGSVDEIKKKKKEEHQRIWDHNRRQDGMLQNHEQRLHELDGKWYEP
ncbi:hypothetical protein H9X85_10710 [Anaerotignum lactatifermentans]|uniref:Uncharacterized protein n=1 Tax=Anaerotignum lactatifermentans TaxID=160404 RepID=A0ABS2GAX8_9FIRM|nr:hypothetical protein [Anaerotignum lactatifermentans]MBM6830027.1 hypothetical protein [Anaerotignum lactatifermentans]MBM6878619.1 hypothetical protein [Anaerotignum lactatifermentans]MBM6951668.1 hypothetical protein [Anaerotignum lactatifermentans]